MKMLVSLLLLFIISCKPTPPVKLTPIETLGQFQNDFIYVIDVREQSEYQSAEKIAIGIHIPLSEIKTNSAKWKTFYNNYNSNKKIVIFSDSDQTNQTALKIINDLNLSVTTFGLLDDWKKANLPIK